MYAEIPIESGEAKVFDYDLAEIRRRDVPMLRRKIGVVFQDFQLLTDRSVADNLLFVLKATGWKDKEEMQERIDEVLKQVGMENKSYKMPHELSGGEQQRVVIARSILNKPKLILADEPTGNLDPETGHQIVLLLRGIAEKGTAVIMATHNINLVEEFPGRVIKCEDKKVVEPEYLFLYEGNEIWRYFGGKCRENKECSETRNRQRLQCGGVVGYVGNYQYPGGNIRLPL